MRQHGSRLGYVAALVLVDGMQEEATAEAEQRARTQQAFAQGSLAILATARRG